MSLIKENLRLLELLYRKGYQILAKSEHLQFWHDFSEGIFILRLQLSIECAPGIPNYECQ